MNDPSNKAAFPSKQDKILFSLTVNLLKNSWLKKKEHFPHIFVSKVVGRKQGGAFSFKLVTPEMQIFLSLRKELFFALREFACNAAHLISQK